MTDVPDMEIIGEVYTFTIEMGADGAAVLVAYAEGEGGTIGRSWLRFDPDATVALQRRTANLRAPRTAPTAPTEGQ